MPVGLPYNINNPRPVKNGQPPPCTGQCNLNIGARKVGAAMKRLPQLYYGDKAKEQILQKWDPVSKRMVNIHDNVPIITMLNNWNLNYSTFTALWSQSKRGPLELQIFTNTINSIEGATPVLSAIFVNGNENVNTYVTNYTSVFRNFYFFTIKPINCIISPARSIVYQLNWYVNGWVPAVVSGENANLTRGIAIDSSGNIFTQHATRYNSDPDPPLFRIMKTTPQGVSSTFAILTNSPWGIYIKSNLLYVTQNDATILTYDITNGATGTIAVTGQARALVMDSLNNMYIQNRGASISKRTPTGTITNILTNTGGLPGTSMGYYRDSANDEYIYYTNTSNYTVNRARVLVNGTSPESFSEQIIAGTPDMYNYAGDGGLATNSIMKAPRGVAVDTFGNVIVMDNENQRIRYIPASTGIIHTICGTGEVGSGTNGVVGTSSQVDHPWAVVFKDPSTAYFTDSNNNTSRVLNLTGHY